MQTLKKYRKPITILLTLIAVGFLVYYIVTNISSFSVLEKLSVGSITLCLILALLMKLMSSLEITVISNALGVKMDFVEWFGVNVCSGAMGVFLPLRADYLLKARYYKKKCDMSYSKFVSLSSGGVVVQLVVIAFEIALSFALLLSHDPSSAIPVIVALAFVILVVVFLFLLFHFQSFFERVLPFKKYSLPIFYGFLEIFRNKSVVVKCFLIHITHQLLSTLQILVIADTLGVPASFASALIYNSVLTLSGILSIIPGNIGITEALVGLTSSVTGGLFANGVVIALASRIINLISYLLVVTIFAYPIFRRLRK